MTDHTPEARPLTAEEERLFREGLRTATGMSGLTNDNWSHVAVTNAQWVDRCRQLLATLDAARAETDRVKAEYDKVLAIADSFDDLDAARAATPAAPEHVLDPEDYDIGENGAVIPAATPAAPEALREAAQAVVSTYDQPHGSKWSLGHRSLIAARMDALRAALSETSA